MNKIKCIAFDFGGVLFTYNSKQLHKDFSKKLGITENLSKKSWTHKLYEFETGRVNEEQYWNAFLEIAKTNYDHNKLRKIVVQQFKPINGIIKIVKKLQKNYIVGMISNHSTIVDIFEKKYNFRRFFNPLIFSHEVGYRKPEKDIFDLFIQKSGCKPNEIIFVDDRLDNIKAAKNHGIIALRFKTSSKLEKDLRKLGVFI